MDTLIRIVFLVGVFLLSVGAFELGISFGILVYRMHLSIFTNTNFHEHPTPRHVRVMERLAASGIFLFVAGFIMCMLLAPAIRKW